MRSPVMPLESCMNLPRIGLLACLCLAVCLTRCDSATESMDYLLGEGQLDLRLQRLGDLVPTTSARVVITIADVRLDGVSLPDFRRKTLDWGGATQDAMLLYNGAVPSGDYHSIELVLDPGTDDRGSGPGCYTLVANGEKQPLRLTGGGVLYIPAESLSVARSEYVGGVVTFNLNQALQATDSGLETDFELLRNSWDHRWASFAPQDPQRIATYQQLPDLSTMVPE